MNAPGKRPAIKVVPEPPDAGGARRRAARTLLLLPALAVVAAACAGDDPGSPADERLRVVSDVPPITNLIENIGADRIQLRGMIPLGVSSHGFEPPPGDIRQLARADLMLFNGFFLADPLYRQAEANRRDGVPIVFLGEMVLPEDEWIFDVDFPEEQGSPNPHIWMDPLRALAYAEIIRDTLAEHDPANAGTFAANFEALRERIEDLHARTEAAVATIPPEHRRLLTYHDCCPYLAERYGFEVIAAVQPSDFGEPSGREVREIIDQVRALDLPAIFGSELFPSPVMEQIADETGAEFVFGIEDDTLPAAPGHREHTYLAMMLENLETIVTALGGSDAAFDGFDATLVYEGDSGAVY